MTEREFIDSMRLLLEPIENKLESIENEMGNIRNDIGNVRNDLRNLEFQNRREHREIRQDIETILVVLEAQNLLPKAQ